MFTTLRQPTQPQSHTLITSSLQKQRNFPKTEQSSVLSLPSKTPEISTIISTTKPLHLSSISSNLAQKKKSFIQCKAYEANRSQPLDINIELPSVKSESAQRVKIGIYFATWWALNVVFNIYNKKVLNAFPYPWLTSTLSLAAGSFMMLISWATRVADPPKTDLDFWKTLLPVAVAHTIGHVAATVSMSKVAVSFTHIIKSGEPAFSVLVSRFLLGESFPLPVYLSLLPIIGGCALSAVTELNFNMIGFMGAMISNLAFVFRNIFSKKGMNGKSVSGMNYYACLSMLSLLLLTPFAIAVEGPKVWAAGWQSAVSQIGPNFVWWVAAQSIFYHLYNQVSYMSLDQISPLTFSVGNTMKRISVIVSSIIIFHTPVQAVNALGAAIAILGTFIYSQVAVAHTIGHVAATVSMSKVAVSFTHIIKSGEPAFSVSVSRALLGELFPSSVYLSLLPIIGGCALAAMTELNFNMIGFMGAMISNLAFVFRNIFSKRGMNGKSVSGMNYYACLSMLSLLILTPFAILVEGPQVWAVGWQTALSEVGPNFIWWVAAQSIFYHLYNQVSYMSLDQFTPLTFSIGNTMKRISVIVSSIIIFRTPVLPVNALGAAIAILGTFIYSQAKS